jgi:hypothetical protein
LNESQLSLLAHAPHDADHQRDARALVKVDDDGAEVEQRVAGEPLEQHPIDRGERTGRERDESQTLAQTPPPEESLVKLGAVAKTTIGESAKGAQSFPEAGFLGRLIAACRRGPYLRAMAGVRQRERPVA